MSMSTVEPGTRLANRFRLEDRVHESGGATLWKALDEILARPVAVHTFTPDFPRVQEVVTAARLASRLTDPRLTQVFDAADEDGTAYVVSEWVSGDLLLDLLESGPVEPERGAALVAEAAEALAHAYTTGSPTSPDPRPPGLDEWRHGQAPRPRRRRRDPRPEQRGARPGGRRGAGPPALRGADRPLAGRLRRGLPPAPLDDGKICTPRQVTAGVPGYLDAIICRALLQEPRRGHRH